MHMHMHFGSRGAAARPTHARVLAAVALALSVTLLAPAYAAANVTTASVLRVNGRRLEVVTAAHIVRAYTLPARNRTRLASAELVAMTLKGNAVRSVKVEGRKPLSFFGRVVSLSATTATITLGDQSSDQLAWTPPSTAEVGDVLLISLSSAGRLSSVSEMPVTTDIGDGATRSQTESMVVDTSDEQLTLADGVQASLPHRFANVALCDDVNVVYHRLSDDGGTILDRLNIVGHDAGCGLTPQQTADGYSLVQGTVLSVCPEGNTIEIMLADGTVMNFGTDYEGEYLGIQAGDQVVFSYEAGGTNEAGTFFDVTNGLRWS